MTNHRIYKERMKRISSFPYSLHLFESLEFLIIFVSSNPPSSSPYPSSYSPNPSSSSPCPSSSSAFRRFSSECCCFSSALPRSSALTSSWAISALKYPQHLDVQRKVPQVRRDQFSTACGSIERTVGVLSRLRSCCDQRIRNWKSCRLEQKSIHELISLDMFRII